MADFDDMFGSDDFGGMDIDNSFGNTEDDFGAFGDDNSFDNAPLGNDESSSPDFSNSINNMNVSEDNGNNLKKNSWIFIVAGAVVVMIVIIVASSVAKHKNKVANAEVVSEQVTVQATQNVNQDANDIMGTNNNNNSTPYKDNNSVDINAQVIKDDGWKEITANESINFTGVSDLEFTITGITHKAKTIDTNNNLVVKTTLQGSLSGLSGVYELDVPYDKGSKLVVGQHFTVKVQLGQYKDKTVVGNISY